MVSTSCLLTSKRPPPSALHKPVPTGNETACSRAQAGLPPRVPAALPHIRPTSSMPSGVPSSNHATFQAPVQVQYCQYRDNSTAPGTRANRRSERGPYTQSAAGTPSLQSFGSEQHLGRFRRPARPSAGVAEWTVSGPVAGRLTRAGLCEIPSPRRSPPGREFGLRGVFFVGSLTQ